jgi:hypothetical protein
MDNLAPYLTDNLIGSTRYKVRAPQTGVGHVEIRILHYSTEYSRLLSGRGFNMLHGASFPGEFPDVAGPMISIHSPEILRSLVSIAEQARFMWQT